MIPPLRIFVLRTIPLIEIQLEYSAFVKIVNNVLEGNVFNGLYLTNKSNGNHVSGNTVRNNTDFGIFLFEAG